VLQLLEDERADAAAVEIGVDGQLFDVERAHVAALEIRRVHPRVLPHDLERALRIGHDLSVDREEELLDAVLFVGLDESLLGPRALVLDRGAVDVAERELQKLPHAIEVAAVNAADDDGLRLLLLPPRGRARLFGRWEIAGLRLVRPDGARRQQAEGVRVGVGLERASQGAAILPHHHHPGRRSKRTALGTVPADSRLSSIRRAVVHGRRAGRGGRVEKEWRDAAR
jgi:hypothetical protein